MLQASRMAKRPFLFELIKLISSLIKVTTFGLSESNVDRQLNNSRTKQIFRLQ